MNEFFARIEESDFVWGFRDIRRCYQEWLRLMNFPSASGCQYLRQMTHDFFNDMSYAVGRDTGIVVWYEKFV
jgi:hypothetical protein